MKSPKAPAWISMALMLVFYPSGSEAATFLTIMMQHTIISTPMTMKVACTPTVAALANIST
jgi:hypothetical protein